MLRGLVGSEMCIRDSSKPWRIESFDGRKAVFVSADQQRVERLLEHCLLYTSDAADDLLRVDLGARRIIQKKKHTTTTNSTLTPCPPTLGLHDPTTAHNPRQTTPPYLHPHFL